MIFIIHSLRLYVALQQFTTSILHKIIKNVSNKQILYHILRFLLINVLFFQTNNYCILNNSILINSYLCLIVIINIFVRILILCFREFMAIVVHQTTIFMRFLILTIAIRSITVTVSIT